MGSAGFLQGTGRGRLSRYRQPPDEGARVAKVTPVEFMRQVRAETAKVTWPSRKETVMTAVMVVIMTTLLAIFFLGVDSAFDAIVKALLKLAQ
jgi:preprotein translocase subunit SecE